MQGVRWKRPLEGDLVPSDDIPLRRGDSQHLIGGWFIDTKHVPPAAAAAEVGQEGVPRTECLRLPPTAELSLALGKAEAVTFDGRVFFPFRSLSFHDRRDQIPRKSRSLSSCSHFVTKFLIKLGAVSLLDRAREVTWALCIGIFFGNSTSGPCSYLLESYDREMACLGFFMWELI